MPTCSATAPIPADHSGAVTGGRYDRRMPPLELVSEFRAAGDQPTAIAGLAAGVEAGERFQTLLGITG